MPDTSADPFDLEPGGWLRFAGETPMSAERLRETLATVERSYVYLCVHAARVHLALVVATHLDDARLVERALEIRVHDEKYLAYEGETPTFLPTSYTLPNENLARLHGRPLRLNRVRLESIGFWEFVGSLNPLAQMRGYIQERHERTKDKDYRNDAEERRLVAEASLKELEVQRAQIEVAVETYEAAALIVGTDDARKLGAQWLTRLEDVLPQPEGSEAPQIGPGGTT